MAFAILILLGLVVAGSVFMTRNASLFSCDDMECSRILIGVGMGLPLGIPIGFLLDNIVLGASAGLLIGSIVGAVLEFQGRRLVVDEY